MAARPLAVERRGLVLDSGSLRATSKLRSAVMVKIEGEQYDSAEQGVTYLATYADRPYSCVLPAEDLVLATRGDEVHDAFRRRMAEIERATESTLRRQTEAGRVVAANLVVDPLAERVVSRERGGAVAA